MKTRLEQQREFNVERLHTKLKTLDYDETGQTEPWKNDVAKDLNWLTGRAVFYLETTADDSDVDLAEATIRIVERVASFEEIQPKDV